MKPLIRNTFLATAMAAALGMAAVALAGPHDCGERAGPEERLEKHLDRMSRHLDLSDTQRSEVEVVLKGSQAEMAVLRTQMRDSHKMLHQLNPEQGNYEAEVARLAGEQGKAMTNLIQLRARTMAGVHPILTEEQREKMQDYKAKKHRHKKGHRQYM